MSDRCFAPLAALVLGAASLAVFATSASAADGVTLYVEKGPGTGSITLNWTGGQPTFEVYRAPAAPGVVAPGNLVASVGGQTYPTGVGIETIAFFVITTPCVIDLPERCDGIDNDCDGTIDEAGAETSCVLPNATAACVAGACAVGSCDPGYADCDGGAVNGCEIATSGFPTDPLHCGACNIVCPSGPNATAVCSASTCSLACAPDYGDCNVNSVDGCEVYLPSSPQHCGACNTVCPLRSNASSTCSSGTCSYACDPGYFDCNTLAGDGCEINGTIFATDPTNCGGCGNVCALPNALGVCSTGQCQLAIFACDPGFIDQNENPTDGCEYACTPTGPDLPDDAFADANCDGIDGDAAAAVFVSPSGNDADPGTKALPVKAIAVALGIASGAGKTQVYVDQGTYVGAVQLINGISLYGGYSRSNGWSRGPANTSTISSGTVVNGAVRGLYGVAITAPTTVDRIRVITTSATGLGQNNYAFHCNNCPAIVIRNGFLQAGSGGFGLAGTPGTNGPSGTNGSFGSAGSCDNNVAASGGPGGASPCGRLGGNGGAGRHAQTNGNAGTPGTGGTPGGVGGNWGDPGTAGQNGASGISGLTGAPGSGGPGGSGSGVVGDNWVGVPGGGGLFGAPGNGGGGAGGGGGQWCTFCDDGTGNGGGGGGGGGCSGSPGSGGGVGGGSFGAFFIASTGFTLENSVVTSGSGGSGGSGGPGGSGGAGGSGGPGASVCAPMEVGRGGTGGSGGAGGAGGIGGGGSGGVSYSVYQSASSGTISGCTLNVGFGGAGGTAPGGNPGGAGASGTIFP